MALPGDKRFYATQLGSRIRDARGPWSLSRAAKECGVAPGTLCKYESGEHAPGAYALAKISLALSVDLNWLVLGEE